MRALVFITVALALVSSAGATSMQSPLSAPAQSAAPGPDDCRKMQGHAENEVCNTQWFDRQLERLQKLALEQADAAGRDVINAEHSRYLARRKACNYDYLCMLTAVEERLAALAPRVNVFEAFARYRARGNGGAMWIVRFGFDAGVKLSDIGGDRDTCTFETDSAPVGGKGVIRFSGTAGDTCRLNIIPEGEDMRVETKNCHDYCAARATLDGLYTHAF